MEHYLEELNELIEENDGEDTRWNEELNDEWDDDFQVLDGGYGGHQCIAINSDGKE